MIGRLLRPFWERRDAIPYTRLASIYDRIMDHVDYTAWAEYLVRLFQAYGSDIRRIVEGGCGTGCLMTALEEKGYDVFGFDIAFEMVRNARRKGADPVWSGDLEAFALNGKWDAFLVIYDTIQYLSPAGLRRFLSNVNDAIDPRGLLIFDVVTESHVRRDWQNYTECGRDKEWEWTRRTWYDAEAGLLNTEFEITFFKEMSVFREHHVQTVFSLRDIESFAEAADFRTVGRLDGFTFNRGTEDSDRVHFVFQREGA